MIPIWTLKVGSVAVTLASTAGFWQYVTQHVHPAKAPLKPTVVQPAGAEEPSTKALTGWEMSDAMRPAATPTPVIVKRVIVQGGQEQAQSSAALGATWIANRTGQKPVTNTHIS